MFEIVMFRFNKYWFRPPTWNLYRPAQVCQDSNVSHAAIDVINNSNHNMVHIQIYKGEIILGKSHIGSHITFRNTNLLKSIPENAYYIVEYSVSIVRIARARHPL